MVQCEIAPSPQHTDDQQTRTIKHKAHGIEEQIKRIEAQIRQIEADAPNVHSPITLRLMQHRRIRKQGQIDALKWVLGVTWQP